ncbi:MAG: type I DNA topoisomerase [Candidatus Cloacimonas sp.]|nr:type I DNA topoisomerase [Candidatus Cloacimonadota bacterium]
MAKNLIIVESPTKARTLTKFLGKDFVVKASMGHIRDLPKKTLGIDVEKGFKPKYEIDRTKSKIIKELRDQAAKSDTIFLAPDHDREGEAIAWHLAYALKDAIKDKKVYRITFNEITQKAIEQAIKEPGDIDQNKVDAQQARRLLDRLVGYQVSPLLWKVITTKLSAGRVQSVALRLICERDAEIEAFVKEEFWTIEGDFYKENLQPFHSVLDKWKGKKVELGNKDEADNVLEAIKSATYKIIEKEVRDRKVQPPPPYITSSLQQDASRILNFTSKKTMMIAQQLYEGVDIKGDSTALISYMRTDSLRLSNEALTKSRELIKQRYGEAHLNPTTKVYKNKSSAQDAHEAIRPTDPMLTPEYVAEFLKPDQLKLYTLIWQRTIATQMKPAELNTVKIIIEAGEGQFKTTGSTIKYPGFLECYKHINLALGEMIDKEYVENDILQIKDLKGVQRFTKPPARYSEATLIKELESKGIGRPSTYASITSTILERKYVTIKEKRFFSTDLGRAVNKFLVANFDSVFNVDFTKNLEDGLDDIAEGKKEWVGLLESYYSNLSELIDKTDIKKAKENLIEETDVKCDKCGSQMILKWSSRGQFLACSNYPTCSNSKSFTRDEEGKVQISKPEVLDEKCPLDGGDLMIKKSRYGEFIGCANYPKCKFTKKITTGVKCPECDKGELSEKKSVKGYTYYSCTNYPECRYRTYKKPVKQECPECGNHYLEVASKPGEDQVLSCPKCKTELR